MNKKGFTLVELLATITIITIVSGLIIPNMIGIVKESKEDTYKAQLKDIEMATMDWINLNTGVAPKEGKQITITLSDLKTEGLIDLKLENAKTGKKFPDDLIINISKNKKYLVDIEENSGTNVDITLYKGTMILKGSYKTKVEINEEYVDEGVSVKDDRGYGVSSSWITKTITKNGTVIPSIDTSIVGEYQIKYEVNKPDVKASKTRYVTVADTKGPKIITPTNTVLSTTETSYNVIHGVSATDNSNENIVVLAYGNLTLGVPGSYIITYKAEDSSGNVSTKKRQIIVSDEFIE